MTTYYDILGASSSASRDELKSCYHNLIRECHPDKSSSETKTDFCSIQKAWEVLGDEKSRHQYDAEIRATVVKCAHPVQEEVKLSEIKLDRDLKHYSKMCRCGGSYIFEESDVSDDLLLVDCDNCSLSIIVDCSDKVS